jgi:hypothetical protein
MKKVNEIVSAVVNLLVQNGISDEDITKVESNCGSIFVDANGKTFTISIMETESEEDQPESEEEFECKECGTADEPEILGVQHSLPGAPIHYQCLVCDHIGQKEDFTPQPEE